MRWNLLLAAIATSWGFVSILVASVRLPSEVLVFWRCAIAIATLPLLLIVIRRVGSLIPRERRWRTAGLGLLLALHWILFFETIHRSSVAIAILTVYTAPVFVAVLAPLILPERRSRIGLAALAISGPGIALIALSGDDGARVEAVAIGTGLLAALTYALLIIGQKTMIPHMSVFPLAFWQWVVALVVLSPFLLAHEDVLPQGREWLWVVLLGAVYTAFTGVIYVRVLREVTAQAAGLLAYIEPVAASLLAWPILGQALGWQVALGGAAVLLGGSLVVLYEGVDRGAPEGAGLVPGRGLAFRMRD